MHLDPDAFRSALDELDPFALADAVRTFYRHYAARFGKPRWGDKTPPYRARVIGIAGLLPEAHLIHLVRDGRDVALSNRGLWFGPGEDVEAAATFWTDEVRRVRADAELVDHHLEIRYEDLVTDPEGTLREVCAFLALPFDTRMLAHHEVAADRLDEIRTGIVPAGSPPVELDRFLAIHEKARHPVDPTRIGRWRYEMTTDERHRFETIAGPLLTDLGYETLRS